MFESEESQNNRVRKKA